MAFESRDNLGAIAQELDMSVKQLAEIQNDLCFTSGADLIAHVLHLMSMFPTNN